MDPDRRVRNRKSKSKGVSWLARSRRLRLQLLSEPACPTAQDQSQPEEQDDPEGEHDSREDRAGGPSSQYPREAFPSQQSIPPQQEDQVPNAPNADSMSACPVQFPSTCEHPPVDPSATQCPHQVGAECDCILCPSPQQSNVLSIRCRVEDVTPLKTVETTSMTMTKPVLLAIMCVYGACAFTSKQYEFLRLILAVANAEFDMPCITTVRRKKWPFFIKQLFPRSSIVRLPRKLRYTDPTSDDTNESDDERDHSDPSSSEQAPSTASPNDSVSTQPPSTTRPNPSTSAAVAPSTAPTNESTAARRPSSPSTIIPDVSAEGATAPQPEPTLPSFGDAVIVPISEWARFDVSNVILRNELICSQDSANVDQPAQRSIQSSPLCTSSGAQTCSRNTIQVKDGSRTRAALVGDSLKFKCITAGPILHSIRTAFQAACGSECDATLTGIVSFSFSPGIVCRDNALTRSLRLDSAFSNFLSPPRSELSTEEAFLAEFIKQSVRSQRESSINSSTGFPSFCVLPGDIITVLKPSVPSSSGVTLFGVLCHRHWCTEADNKSQLFYSIECNLSNPTSATFRTILSTEFIDIPTVLNSAFQSTARQQAPSAQSTARQQAPPEAKTSGKLKDGRPYIVYRVLLYCDDFIPRSSLFPKGAVGGVYFLPLSLQSSRRRGSASIRTISLTPKGVSTNEVLDRIIPDIIAAMTDGIPSFDADGNEVHIFIDVIGFVGDYPESSKVIDILSHSARAPCTHCSFRHRTVEDSARYAYSITIHSCTCSFSRNFRRMLSIRSANPSSDDLQFLGMNDGTLDDIMEPGRWPLVKLACEIDRIKSKIPLTDEDVPVVSTSFDPYARNAVAPDHLLAGIGKFLIECVFRVLPTAQQQFKLDVALCRDLQVLGMGTHSALFNTTTKKLHGISISTVFTTLMLLGPHFYALQIPDTLSIIPIIDSYYRLISLTFWWPSIDIDGVDAFNYVHGREESTYYDDMIKLAKDFVAEISKLCATSSIVRKLLDKPNIHRILELYVTTIPQFSHALFCLDMAFEHHHQPLKSSLLRNSNPNCHLAAVYHSLGVDWFSRVCELIVKKNATTLSSSAAFSRSLRRLFFGDSVLQLEKDSSTYKDLLSQLDAQVDDILQPDFIQLLVKWYSSRLGSFPQGVWTGIATKVSTNNVCDGVTVRKVRKRLQRHLDMPSLTNIHIYQKLNYIQRIGTIPRRSYPQHTVSVGDFIGCFIEDVSSRARTGIFIPSTVGQGSFTVFRVCTILGTAPTETWLGAVKGIPRSGNNRRKLFDFPIVTDQNITLLKLTPTVRKCFGVHACDIHGRCRVNENKTVTHRVSNTSSLTYTILSRKDGYPPRRA